jgi:hypothetical protein
MNEFQEQAQCELESKKLQVEERLTAAHTYSCGHAQCAGACKLFYVRSMVDDAHRLAIAAKVFLPEAEAERVSQWADDFDLRAQGKVNEMLKGTAVGKVIETIEGAVLAANTTAEA